MTETNLHGHYFRDVSGLQKIDVYRLLELFDVTCPVAQHVVKKALAAGKRGAKDSARDMKDIQDSAARWLEMRQEDLAPIKNPIDVEPGLCETLWGTGLHKTAPEVVKNAITRDMLKDDVNMVKKSNSESAYQAIWDARWLCKPSGISAGNAVIAEQ